MHDSELGHGPDKVMLDATLLMLYMLSQDCPVKDRTMKPTHMILHVSYEHVFPLVLFYWSSSLIHDIFYSETANKPEHKEALKPTLAY